MLQRISYAGYFLVGLLLSGIFVIVPSTITGSESSNVVVLLLAYIIAIVFVSIKANAGKGEKFAFVLALPVVMVWVWWVFLMGWAFVKPDPEVFADVCRNVGATYIKPPPMKVRSIAYEGDGDHTRRINQYSLTLGTRISDWRISNPPYPESIEFIERQRPDAGNSFRINPDEPYVRSYGTSGVAFPVRSLSADVLVSYQISPMDELPKAVTEQGVVKYEVTVTYRPTNEKLAILRYVIDGKSRRACGVNEDGLMDERKFLLKAIRSAT